MAWLSSSDARITHGTSSRMLSMRVSQSSDNPTPEMTTGEVPQVGSLIGCVRVGMKGLWGIVSLISAAFIAVARPWRRWGSILPDGLMDMKYPR